MKLSESSMRSVSIVLVAPEERRLLEPALTSIYAQNFPSVEVVVVGLQGAEGIAKFLRGFDVEAICISVEDDNLCLARNAGAAEASGDLLLFMKGSTGFPHENSLGRMVQFFRTHDLEAASFRLIDSSDDEIPWYQWAGPGDSITGRESPVLHPSAALVRKKMFERVGGFWEPYNREVAFRDLAARILMTGESVRYFSGVTLQDMKPRRALREQLLTVRFATRNRILFAVRTFSLPRAFWWGMKATLAESRSMFRRSGGWRSWLAGLVLCWKDLPAAWASRQVASPDRIGPITGQFPEEKAT